MIFFILIIILFLIAIFVGVLLVVNTLRGKGPKLLEQNSVLSGFTGPSKGHEYILVIVGLVWAVTWSIALIAFIDKNFRYIFQS